jgi:hypothetical protein
MGSMTKAYRSKRSSGILELRFGGAPDLTESADSEPLRVVIGA